MSPLIPFFQWLRTSGSFIQVYNPSCYLPTNLAASTHDVTLVEKLASVNSPIWHWPITHCKKLFKNQFWITAVVYRAKNMYHSQSKDFY